MNEYVVAFTGPRGGGKSLTMAYWTGRFYLLKGINCWSNMPIKVPLKDEVYTASDLNTADLFTMEEKLRNGLLCIDEIARWVNSRRSGTNRNLVFDFIMQQIRKLSLSVYYTVQDITWVDLRLRFQTDIEVYCRDAFFTGFGKDKGIAKGNMILLDIKDLTGKVTGLPYYQTGRIVHKKLKAKPIWKWYDSKQAQDIFDGFEAFDPKPSRQDNRLEEYQPLIEQVLDYYSEQGTEKVTTYEFWAEVSKRAGVDLSPIKRKLASRYLPGLRRTRLWTGETAYIFN